MQPKHQLTYICRLYQPSKFTSAVGNCRGFCRGKQYFYSNYLGQNIAEVIISQQNIYSVYNFPYLFLNKIVVYKQKISLACAREESERTTRSQIYYIFSAVFSSPFSHVFKFFLPSYIFQVQKKTLQGLELMLKRSHKYDLVRKKRECQSFDVCPRQHQHNFCYLMIVLVREVLSAKLVLRYKQKFEAIIQALSQN